MQERAAAHDDLGAQESAATKTNVTVLTACCGKFRLSNRRSQKSSPSAKVSFQQNG